MNLKRVMRRVKIGVRYSGQSFSDIDGIISRLSLRDKSLVLGGSEAKSLDSSLPRKQG